MSIMPDHWIRRMSKKHDMISPFIETQQRGNVISYGLSSYGYDARVADEFHIFTDIDNAIVDPKNFPENGFIIRHGDITIPPNSFALARTIERFCIPEDVLVICLGKSTYARCGIIINVTPLEPGWKGYVTIEISNTTPLPARIYANEGICQFLFFRGDSPCEVDYADRSGKYMYQKGVTHSRIESMKEIEDRLTSRILKNYNNPYDEFFGGFYPDQRPEDIKEILLLTDKEYKEIKNGERVKFREGMNPNMNTNLYRKAIVINALTSEQCFVFFDNGGSPCIFSGAPWIELWTNEHKE